MTDSSIDTTSSSTGARRGEKVLGVAGGFTGLWALTWLGAAATSPNAALQGGFAVGSVMASSGLTLLWWKTRALRHLVDAESGETAAGDAADEDELSAAPTQGT